MPQSCQTVALICFQQKNGNKKLASLTGQTVTLDKTTREQLFDSTTGKGATTLKCSEHLTFELGVISLNNANILNVLAGYTKASNKHCCF